LPGSWRLHIPGVGDIDGARPKLQEVGWDDGAKKAYYAFSEKLDALEGTKNYELSLRVCENAVRLATIVAVGRRSKVVERPDMVLMALRAHPPLYAGSPIPAAAFALANPLQLAFAVEVSSWSAAVLFGGSWRVVWDSRAKALQSAFQHRRSYPV
jgi:hypothetical protein